MELTDHILKINETIAELGKQFNALRAERHVPSKSLADEALIDLEIAAVKFRRMILKLTTR